MDILLTAFGIVCIIGIWVALYDSNRFVVVKHQVKDARIHKNCRAVVLADLHNKCYGRNNEKLIEAVRACKPDFILVAGDLLTAKPGASPKIALHLLEELSKDYPIYYANGNHEHRLILYPEKYGKLGEEYEKGLRDRNVTRLVNAHVSLKESGIAIYGSQIDRFFYKRFHVQHMDADYMDKLLGTPDRKQYTILLAHNPDYFPQYADWGADLVFSGHVHGGMVRVPFWGRGVVSPNVRLFPKYDGGVFTEGKATMLLSRGLGMHTIPVRLFNPGELLCVDFTSQGEN